MNKLRELRKNKNLSQKEVASMLGCHQGSYSMMEKGLRGISVVNAKKLGKIYGIEWWRLYDDNDIDYLRGAR